MEAAATQFESHRVSHHDKTPAFTAVTEDLLLCSCLIESNLLQLLLNRDFNKLRCQGRSKSSSWGVVQNWRYCVHCRFLWGPGGIFQSADVYACVCIAATVGRSTKTSHLFPIKLASSVSHGEGSEAEA